MISPRQKSKTSRKSQAQKIRHAIDRYRRNVDDRSNSLAIHALEETTQILSNIVSQECGSGDPVARAAVDHLWQASLELRRLRLEIGGRS
jgi:hypothetical protein